MHFHVILDFGSLGISPSCIFLLTKELAEQFGKVTELVGRDDKGRTISDPLLKTYHISPPHVSQLNLDPTPPLLLFSLVPPFTSHKSLTTQEAEQRAISAIGASSAPSESFSSSGVDPLHCNNPSRVRLVTRRAVDVVQVRALHQTDPANTAKLTGWVVIEDRVTQDWLGLREAIPCVHLHQRWREGRGNGGLVNPILRDLLRFLAAVTPLLLGLLESGMSATVGQARYASGHGVTQDRVMQHDRSRCTFPAAIFERGIFLMENIA